MGLDQPLSQFDFLVEQADLLCGVVAVALGLAQQVLSRFELLGDAVALLLQGGLVAGLGPNPCAPANSTSTAKICFRALGMSKGRASFKAFGNAEWEIVGAARSASLGFKHRIEVAVWAGHGHAHGVGNRPSSVSSKFSRSTVTVLN